ncbi:FG-GAP repeat domain-containing protein [Maritalea sp.]|jgi:hypothetical protein|uniref:FG-GAP repeat domain-containing protein n=1 Tax=Maritalea sp. TaxID=2003361 RepID=UPI0039E416DC
MRSLPFAGWLFFALALSLPAMAQGLVPLPNSFVVKGENQVARAWLANPTTRYQHFVLGDQFEAASLVVELRNGTVLRYDLPQNLVIEDRHVRLADLDNDGKDELIVVMSSILQGAAMAVFSVDQEITLLAQTPHIGLPSRWLNPAGIADYDGDGKLEIALVQKPHLTKRLEFWRLAGKDLRRVAAMDGFSNHRIGSRNQLMSANFDVNNDGVIDLLLPGSDRQNIKAVTLFPTPKTLKSWALPSPVDGAFSVRGNGEKQILNVILQNGEKHAIDLN